MSEAFHPTSESDSSVSPLVRRIAAVAWPAFVGAGLIEMLVFAHVEPAALHTLDGSAIELSATAVYSLAFLAFWALVGATCWVAVAMHANTAGQGEQPPSAG